MPKDGSIQSSTADPIQINQTIGIRLSSILYNFSIFEFSIVFDWQKV